jgi:CheY-like chemotaxis protein
LIAFLRKLLIAENNKNDITFYQCLFSNHGYRVLIATDSEESLKKYKAEMVKAAAVSEMQKRRRREGQKKRGLLSRDHFFFPSSPVVMPFDAVMLNHRVSDTDGIHVAKDILSFNPHQRVVFVSESVKYTTEVQNEFKGKVVDVMQKPFYPEALIELLGSAKLYQALKDLGVNIKKIREANLYHFQLLDLLSACRDILRENGGNQENYNG